MARVTLNRKHYKRTDLTKFIKKEMIGANLLQRDMADALGIKQQTFSYKLEHCSFDYSDLLTIFEILQVSEENMVKLMSIRRKA